MLAAMRLAGVAPKVNLRNPIYAGDETFKCEIHPVFEPQDRNHQKSKTGASVSKQKSKIFKKTFHFLTDYCPINPERVCLPNLYINFDNGLVLENHGTDFVASMVSKHICCVRCLKLEMSNNICLYCVFNSRMNCKLYFLLSD